MTKEVPGLKKNHTNKPLSKRIEEADLFGYNAEALKIYLAIAGYSAGPRGVAKVLGCAYGTAYKRYATGEYRRLELQIMQEKLHLTPEQMRDIFFTGKEGVFVALKNRKEFYGDKMNDDE